MIRTRIAEMAKIDLIALEIEAFSLARSALAGSASGSSTGICVQAAAVIATSPRRVVVTRTGRSGD